MIRASINGLPTEYISIQDRGLQYGDGLFETMKFADGRLQYWSAHYQRLSASAERLGIPCPLADVLLTDVSRLLAAERYRDCVIKLILSRGLGDRGYRISRDPTPNRMVMLFEQVSPVGGPVILTRCEQRISTDPLLAGIKTLNRLENVMARSEWHDEFYDGVMLDQDDHIIETTMANVFLVKNDVLSTPVLDRCGIEGVMRSRVMEIATRDGMPLECDRLTIDRLCDADAVFLTNSLIGMRTVEGFGDLRYHEQVIIERLKTLLNEDIREHGHALA